MGPLLAVRKVKPNKKRQIAISSSVTCLDSTGTDRSLWHDHTRMKRTKRTEKKKPKT